MKTYERRTMSPQAARHKARRLAAAARGLLLTALLCSGAAHAQSACEAVYRFDGNLSDSSGNGNDGTAFGRDGQAAPAAFGEGISGQALLFDGATGIAAPLDLHYDGCPQVTITGWLRLNTPTPRGANYIFSVGAGGPHGVYVFERSVVLRGRGNGLSVRNALRDDRAWFFFAGVYDFDAGTFRLQFRNRTVEGNLAENLREPEGEIFFGVRDANLTSPATDIFLDEVQIIGRALNDEEIGQVVAQVTRRPWLTAIAHDAARTAGSAQGSVNAGLRGPVEAGGAGSGLSMPTSGPGPLPRGPASGEDYAAANDDGQTLEEMRQSAAERNPLSGAGETVANSDRGNRPLDLEGGSGGSGSGSYAPEPTIPHPTGSKRYSGISGSRGDILREVDLYRPDASPGNPFNAAWLTEIRMGENGDRPCYVAAVGLRPVDAGNTRRHDLWEEELSLTGCGASWMLILGSSRLVVELPQGRPDPEAGGDATAVGQLQVCHNDRNNRRVKGLRINGARINADGTQTVGGNADSAERTNCRSWAPAVLCPDATMATGLVVHATEASGDNEQIVGLQLICRDVSVRL